MRALRDMYYYRLRRCATARKKEGAARVLGRAGVRAFGRASMQPGDVSSTEFVVAARCSDGPFFAPTHTHIETVVIGAPGGSAKGWKEGKKLGAEKALPKVQAKSGGSRI